MNLEPEGNSPINWGCFAGLAILAAVWIFLYGAYKIVEGLTNVGSL